MNRLLKAVLGVVAMGAVGCGDPFFLEVEAPRVCEKTQAVTFDGAPVELPVATLQKELEYKLATAFSDSEPMDVESRVRLIEVRFIATEFTESLDFIQNATVDVEPPAGSALERVQVLSFERGGAFAGSRELVLQGNDDTVDLRNYADGESLRLTTSLTGAWPQQGATMDVGACVSLQARANPL